MILTTYIYAFLSVIIVSAVSFVGVFTLSLKEELLRKYIFIFISLAVGALLGGAFIHLIPESLESSINPVAVSSLIVAGIMAFFLVEKFFHWHHHGEDSSEPQLHPVGKLVLISDGIHNVTDGIIIGISFMVNVPLGIATTIAVVLHEIPQEIGDFSVLLHSGYKRSRALWLNFLSGLSAVVGVFIAFYLGESGDGLSPWILPVAAGGFIYIAIADLIPELHKNKKIKHSLLQVISIIIGILTMIALTFLE